MKSKSSAGMLALLLIVLFDAGLLIWYWNRHQGNQEKYASIDVGLPQSEFQSAADSARAVTAEAPPKIPAETSPTPSSLMIKKEPGFGGGAEREYALGAAPSPSGTSPRTTVPNAFVGAGRKSDLSHGAGGRFGKPVDTRILSRAIPFFWALLQKDRYRRSWAINQWNKDFHSYPDLKAFNNKFHRDHDVMFFMVSTVQSSNFAKMVAKYGRSPDIQPFIRDAWSDPHIAGASQELFRDRRIMEAVKNITLPGFPSIGALMRMGQGSNSPSSTKTLEQMKNDPNLKKYMEQQGLPAVPLQ